MKKNRFCLILIIFILTSLRLVFGQEEPAQPAKVPVKETAQNKISLDIKGMDIVDVLKMLAQRSGMNIVVGKNVTGKVTVFLKGIDPQDAFEIVLLANDLAYDKKGEVINVMTQRDYELLYGERFLDKKQAKIIVLKYAKAADLSRSLNLLKTNIGRIVADETTNTLVLIDTPEKIKEMEEFIKLTDIPIQTKIFNLNYAQADKIQAKLQEAITKAVGSIKIDERTNKIIVTDYPQKLTEIAKIIAAFDEKTPQVLIDAQIVEIKPSDKFEMGVDWDYWIKKHFQVSSALPISSSSRLLIGTPSNAPSEPGDYKAILDLLRTIGDTKILSSPRLTVLNNQEAKILVGTREPYITSTTTITQQTPVTSQTVNFVDVGLKLYVTPTINHDNFVTMKIRPEVSSAERAKIKSEGVETEIPIVSTSETETTVMVKDGVTIIIGGLRKDQKTKTVKKIPFLGDIPLLGLLFKSTSDDLQKTELVILLTPHITSGESSYTDLFEIKPLEGAVARMEKGEIITEKISSSKQIEALGSMALKNEPYFNYYQLIVNKIGKIARLNQPKGLKGEVNLNFSLTSDGNLIDEPKVIDATEPPLSDYAIQSIKNASPFPPFPPEMQESERTFKVSLSYE